LLQLARDVAEAEKQVVPEEEQDRGKAALTELFEGIRTEKTPVMVERVVGDIDEIVRIVRFPGWQQTMAGEREVQHALRKTLLKYQLHKDQDQPRPVSAKFTASFDEVFRTEGAEVIRTPIRAPKANAYAERWVSTVRAECLDWVMVLGSRHLERVLRTYARHYNQHRPHRGLALDVPEPQEPSTPTRARDVRRRDVLGGLIHEYQGVAA